MRRLAGRRRASRAGSAAAGASSGAEAQVVAHGHCHQKAFCGTHPLTAALEASGARVRTLDSGCCGMAGSFGYTADHFDLSLAIGERRLFPAVRALSAPDTLVAAGTSCRHQLRDAVGRDALHPAQYIARAITPAD